MITRLRLTKLLRDVWATRTRVAMMIVAIALSVLAVTAFLSARSILDREIAANYAATSAPSATLHVPSGVDDSVLELTRSDDAVIAAGARESVLGRIRIGDGPWRILLLFLTPVDDARELGLVTVENGTWPPASDELYLERTAMDWLGLEPGANVTVEAGGPPVAMTVAGGVHDGGVAPAQQEQTAYGYATTAALGGISPTQLTLLVGDSSGPSGDPAFIAGVAQRVAAALAAQGHPVSTIDLPPPLKHPHQGQMATVGSVLLAFGVASLLLSSILVATLLGGMLTGQIRQIGAMKAIGAGTGQVLGMYLWLAVAIGLAASAIGVAPGILLGQLMADQGAQLLNLDLFDRSVPAWIPLVAVAAGTIVPLLVALVPLVRASSVTVRQAMDDHGAAASPRTARTSRRALPGVSRPVLMALRNTVRRRGRLVLVVGMLGAAGALFLTGLNAASGWSALVDQGIDNRHYDLEIRLAAPSDPRQLGSLIGSVDGVSTVEVWGRAAATVHVAGLVDVSHSYPDDSHSSFTAIGVPDGSALITPPIIAGRWIEAGDTDAIVLNSLVLLQQAPGATVGDSIALTIGGHTGTWRIVGIVSDFGTQGTAYLSTSELESTIKTAGSTLVRVVTSTHDADGRAAALAGIEAALGSSAIAIEQDFTVDTIQAALDGHVAVLIDALVIIAGMLGIVGLLGLATIMTTAVAERTREFAVLSVIGATRADIRSIVVTEGIVIGIASLAFGALLALPLTNLFGSLIGVQAFRQPLPWVFPPAGLLLWSVLVIAGGAIASLAAARRASRLTVREALITL